MTWPVLAIVAIGLAMDAFAISVATGLVVERVRPSHVFRLACSFGFFQFAMTVLGWFAGQGLAPCIRQWTPWVAFGLLTAIGVKMLVESFVRKNEPRSDPSRGWMLLTLSLATSFDALAVGLSLALLEVSVWFPSIVIGLVAAVLSAVGVLLGKRIGARLGHWTEAFGGCVLIGIGLKVLLDHLAA